MSQPRAPLATGQIDRTVNRVPHLLIADDRVIELRLLLEMIQQTGYRISVAFDGEQAYQRAQALQPDLILLDVQMPGLNGINACRLIRNNPATRHIPIIFLSAAHELHDRLVANVEHFREGMMAAGFDIKPTQSAICAVMLYDAKLSQVYAAKLQEEGIYVTGFYYPVVPKDQARIRVQISAGHDREHLDKCIAAFIKVGKELGVLK